MKADKLKRIVLSFLLVSIMVSSFAIVAYAGTIYANRFESYESGGYYNCRYVFTPAHIPATDEPYCGKGEQIKQAWVRAYRNAGVFNDAYTTPKKYSPVAYSKTSTAQYSTPTASIENLWYAYEYTTYNYSVFK